MPPSPATTDRPLILAVGFHRLQKLLRELAPEYRDQVDVEIISSRFEQAILDIQARNRQRRVEAVVSAGTNGEYLAAQLDLPVVQVRVDGHDILKALTTARAAPGRIALLLHGDIPRHVEDFIRAFQLDVILRSYRSPQEAQACVRELGQDDITTVVAPGLITDLAQHAGMTGVFLYSHESVRRALDEAVTLVQASRAERARHERQLAPSAQAVGEPRRRPRHDTNTTRYSLQDLIGEHPAIQSVRELTMRFASSDATVLITGESGSGKEIVAQSIHAASRRRQQPFVAVNCGAIPETLLESELFGYVEGAFTGARRGGHAGLFEAAHGGTLFLDEIGELPASLQSRLLRVLQERQVLRLGATEPVPIDVRILAATHHDLAQRVHEQRFRMDLYYRLNILRLQLPPLREHLHDLPAITQHRLQAIAHRTGLDPAAVIPHLPQFFQLAASHAWPGNVRELENYLERLLITTTATQSRQEPLRMNDILPELTMLNPAESGPESPRQISPQQASPQPVSTQPVSTQAAAEPLRGFIDAAFAPARPEACAGIARAKCDGRLAAARGKRPPPSPAELAAALQASGGNKETAARRLGISRTTLWRYLKTAKDTPTT